MSYIERAECLIDALRHYKLRRLVIPLKGRQEKVFLLLALPFLPIKVPHIYSKFAQKPQGWFLQWELSRKKVMLFPSHLVTRDSSKKTFVQPCPSLLSRWNLFMSGLFSSQLVNSRR